MALLNLDLAGYHASGSNLAPIPSGDYEVLIVGSCLKESPTPGRLPLQADERHGLRSEGASHYSGSSQRPFQTVEFELVVLGPVCRGARLRDSFALGEQTSMCRMKALAVAARCPTPDFIGDTVELHGLRCRVRVEKSGGFRSSGSENVISGYMPSGVRVPLRWSLAALPPSASHSAGRRLFAERMESVRHQPCTRSYPWKA
jgi:hypothetical protein